MICSDNPNTFDRQFNMRAENILNIQLQDLNEVMSLIKEAIAEMDNHHIFQWDEVYPDYKTLSSDIQSETMFGIFKNAELAGIVVLDKNQSQEYSDVKWELDNDHPLIMHRLCVRPKYQGQGIAKQLIKFSEQFAIENGLKSLRLDAFSANPSAINLYERNGYLKRGIVKFRKGNFYCYEKVL